MAFGVEVETVLLYQQYNCIVVKGCEIDNTVFIKLTEKSVRV